MKYFSIQDWKTGEPWDQIQEKQKRYREYVQTIRPQLPPDLQWLCDFSPGWNEQRISLNDSQVSQITASFKTGTITLALEGKYTDKNGRQLGQRHFSLNYIGVTEFRVEANAEDAYHPGPAASSPDDISDTDTSANLHSDYRGSINFDDHGWDEIELIAEGVFEHRMLFASGTEIHVRFCDFQLDYADTPHDLASD